MLISAVTGSNNTNYRDAQELPSIFQALSHRSNNTNYRDAQELGQRPSV